MNAVTRPLRALLAIVTVCGAGTALGAPAETGRLFYTPAQRAQLEAVRSRGGARPAAPQPSTDDAPQRYDGVIIRSDGQVTRWVDGKPATAAPHGLAPGQTRAGGKVFEPYQLLPSAPAQPARPEDTRP